MKRELAYSTAVLEEERRNPRKERYHRETEKLAKAL